MSVNVIGPCDHLQINHKLGLLPDEQGYSMCLAVVCIFTGFVILCPEKDQQNWLDEWECIERVVYLTIKTHMEHQQVLMQETEHCRWPVAVNFEIGTIVFVMDETRISKLQSPYEGPFMVVGQDGHGLYILKDGMNKCLKHHFLAHMLKLAKCDNEGNMAYDVDVLEVGHILGARATSTGSYDYLVKLKPNIPHIIEWNPCWVEGGS